MTSILPREVFKYSTAQQAFEAESNEFWEFDYDSQYWNLNDKTVSIPGKKTCECGKEVSFTMDLKTQDKKLKCDKGIYVPIKDAMFPYKACSDEAMPSCNMLKAVFIESLKTAANWTSWPSLLLTALSIKNTQKAIDSFNRIGHKVMVSYILKDQYLSDFAKALHFLIFTFLMEYGISESSADLFAENFVHLIEYDNAYRLRLEDVFSESGNEAWNNPRKEALRLSQMFLNRESKGKFTPLPKYRIMAQILSWILLLPGISRAVKTSFQNADFKALGYDDCDKYWASMRTDYDYFGLSDIEREKYAESNGWIIPKGSKK